MTETTEHDVRAMLTERAAEVPVDAAGAEAAISARLARGGAHDAPVVISLDEHRRPRWLAGAAAAAVVAIVGAGIVLATDGDDQVDTAPADTAPSTTEDPPPVTPVADGATPLYTAEGRAEEVAAGYLKDRLDGFSQVEVGSASAGPAGNQQGVRWRTYEQPEPTSARVTMYAGDLVLRPEGDGRWSVLSSDTDGLVHAWQMADGHLTGSISADGDDSVAVRFVNEAGDEVARPEVHVGDCAGQGCLSYEVDLPTGVYDMRVQHVGGTWLSITEVRVESKPTRPDEIDAIDVVARRWAVAEFGEEVTNSWGSIDAVGVETAEGRVDQATVLLETASGATIEVHLRAPTGTERWRVVEGYSPGFSVILEDDDLVIVSPQSGIMTATGHGGELDEPTVLLEGERVEQGEPVRIDDQGAEYLELAFETDEGPVLRYFAIG